MIYEVAAAVDHIVHLIQQIERDQPLASDALAGFASTLKDALEKRCQRCWKPADPECGSAQRSVAWQLHPAGEGADRDLLCAFASVVQAHAEEGELVHPHHADVVALAMQWLPVAFTLWIDPGCVAVRRGSGPGASRSSYDFDLLKSGSSSTAVHVVWGHMMAHSSSEGQGPQLMVSSAPRPIPIVKPVAAPAPSSRYPAQLAAHGRPASSSHHHSHQRTLSTSSSSASSSCGGLVRSVSLSSTHTVSTDATSLGALEADDAQSDAACPSLCSPASSLVSSQCTPSTDRDSVYDSTLGDVTERFTGVRLFGDEDDEEEEDAGDVTISASRPTMLGLSVSKDSAAAVLGAGFVAMPVAPAKLKPKPVVAASTVKCNYTTHDNGNVGVLGGGVRLGGSTSKPSSSQQQAPRHRQHSNSKSISHLQGGLHHQLVPPPYVAHAMARQLHPMNGANYSAPMRTIPLPSAAPQPQHFPHAYAPQGSVPYGHAAQLPMPYGFRGGAPPQQGVYTQYAHPALPHHVDAESMEDDDAAAGEPNGARRRLRSRGRRSRGRGAGRAARRQAAALRALELGSTDELVAPDDVSRCSTPATASEYTDGSSCYSSATSSPAKPSRADLKDSQYMHHLGAHLHANLARLQLA